MRVEYTLGAERQNIIPVILRPAIDDGLITRLH